MAVAAVVGLPEATGTDPDAIGADPYPEADGA
jgi:hypothetical protein